MIDSPILFSSLENASNFINYSNGGVVLDKPQDMKDLVDNSSEEWYRVGPHQKFIPTTSLTLKGREEYKKATERALTETPKNILEQTTVVPVSCGM